MRLMPRPPVLIALLLSCALAAGCGQDPPHPAGSDAGPGATPSGKGQGFIARQVAAAIEEATRELHEGNIRLGGGPEFSFNGYHYSGADTDESLPRAELTPTGELLIAGDAVATTPAQHRLLLAYRRELEGVLAAGVAVGAQGADIAGVALGGLGQAVFGGAEGRRSYEARVEAEAHRIEEAAMALCNRLAPLYESQEALAATLPEFAPYATLTAEDPEECAEGLRQERPREDTTDRA